MEWPEDLIQTFDSTLPCVSSETRVLMSRLPPASTVTRKEMSRAIQQNLRIWVYPRKCDDLRDNNMISIPIKRSEGKKSSLEPAKLQKKGSLDPLD